MTRRKTTVFASLLLFGAVGCADLSIDNPNAPGRAQVVTGTTDLEALVGGSFESFWYAQNNFNSPFLFLSTAAFEHSGMAANFGMVAHSAIPRAAIDNSPVGPFAEQLEYSWDRWYRTIAAANDGLVGIGDRRIADDAVRTERMKAFAHFMRGLSHGYLALTYSDAFIIPADFAYNEDAVPAEQGLELSSYGQVMDAAFADLDRAMAIAQATDFTIAAGDGWVPGLSITSNRMIALIHSFKARFMAEMARTPDERAAVDWAQVISHIQAGITDDFAPVMDNLTWWAGGVYYPNALWGPWGKVPMMMHGMADQSGNYQSWLATPLTDRLPFEITTPDHRFPQGTPGAEGFTQGLYVSRSIGGQGNPERGTWRWSNYLDSRWWARNFAGLLGPHPWLTQRELRLLHAEALYRLGDRGGAADLINVTRVANGKLSPANAAGTNDSCVPKLPDGSCGGLFEQLKWEKRLETYHERLGGWFFDSRGWGDLVENTYLHLAPPGRDLQNFGLAVYTFGGPGDPDSAGPSNYDFGF